MTRMFQPLLRPFQTFFRLEAAGGLLLFACAVVAIVWANSPLAGAYFDLWATIVTVGFGGFAISKPLLLWINDGLMAVFFFVVGLEIKREILAGELSSPKKAGLALAGALGGMVVPALFYTALNAGTPAVRGWGIPMATDIAFALGALALLGRRVPLALKVLLTALAIVDDLGAVLVIALFYTADLSWAALGAGAVFFAALVVAGRAGVRHPLVYAVLGAGLWVALLTSGVHATIAGVLTALTVPARTSLDAPAFLSQARASLDAFAADMHPARTRPSPEQRNAVAALELVCVRAETPLHRMEHALHGWVAFAIMPLFALANAGVAFGGAGTAANPITLGIVLGLLAGKQIGITAFAWLAVRLGFAELPRSVSWRHFYGMSCLCGIGFTMSLFIATLAFPGDAAALDSAKIGIRGASRLAGRVGWLVLARTRPVAPASTHDAEV